MGFPTFTFETDDEQWALGTTEPLSSRLGEEMDVMRYLITNIWYWRARLSVTSFEYNGDSIELNVDNLGRASTTNATVQYIDSDEVTWTSDLFSVNATNSSHIHLDTTNLSLTADGHFELFYQKRVIDASLWVNESIPEELIKISDGEDKGWLPFTSPIWAILAIGLAGIRRNERFHDGF
jgi:hypothetical protein